MNLSVIPANKSEHRRFANLLHHYRQIHAGMDCTQKLESAAGIKRPKGIAIVAVKRMVICGRAALFAQFYRTTCPGAVGDDMLNRDIINDRDRLALANGDAALGKVGSAHMRNRATGATRCAVNATGSKNGGQDRQQGDTDQQFFIHEKNPFKSPSD